MTTTQQEHQEREIYPAKQNYYSVYLIAVWTGKYNTFAVIYLGEVLLMSTYNQVICGEIRKIIVILI